MKLHDLVRQDGKELKNELKLRRRKNNPGKRDGHPSDQVEGDGDGDMSAQAFDWGPEVPT